jgi:two-component system LytT family response regulator
VVLVEDEEPARARLEELLARDARFALAASAGDLAAARAAIAAHRPALAILDIQLAGATAFDLLESLAPAETPLVLFVTAYDEHAVRAFEHAAVDYVLKPVDPARFALALDRVHARSSSSAPRPARIAVRSHRGIALLELDEIRRVESARNYLRIFAGTREYLRRQTLAAFVAALPVNAPFLRVDRSRLLHRQCARALHRVGRHLEVELEDGTRWRVGARWKDAVLTALTP